VALAATPAAPGEGMPTSVAVHALPLVAALDHHSRLGSGPMGGKAPGGGERAIGALLGSYTPGGGVRITDSFGVFHFFKESEVLLRRSRVSELLDMHRRVNPKETIVGWYSTVASPTAPLIDVVTVAVVRFS